MNTVCNIPWFYVKSWRWAPPCGWSHLHRHLVIRGERKVSSFLRWDSLEGILPLSICLYLLSVHTTSLKTPKFDSIVLSTLVNYTVTVWIYENRVRWILRLNWFSTCLIVSCKKGSLMFVCKLGFTTQLRGFTAFASEYYSISLSVHFPSRFSTWKRLSFRNQFPLACTLMIKPFGKHLFTTGCS